MWMHEGVWQIILSDVPQLHEQAEILLREAG